MRSFQKNSISRGLAVMAVAASLLVGCNDSSPTEPKVVAAPTPAPPVVSIWDNTVQRITAYDNCLGGNGGGTVGQAFQTQFELRKTGDSVVFYPTYIEYSAYTGTVNGGNFIATSPAEDGGLSPCGHNRLTGSLSGRFSEDGNHLTATEVMSYTFDSGQVSTITYSWSASRH